MKTLKTLTAWLMILACFNLVSCSNDDDNDDDSSDSVSLVGTWQYKEDNNYVETFTFESDGTFQETSKEFHNGKWEVDNDYGDYEYKDKTISLYYSHGETIILKVLSLTSKTLKVDDDGDIIAFRKI